jgi:hypothetical protein
LTDVSSTPGGVAERAAATANRLRLIQIDLADAEPGFRRDYLLQEVKKALDALAPEDRKPFLDEMMARFPTWDRNVEVAADEPQVPIRSATDAAELRDPSFLVERLIDVVRSVPEPQRQVVVQRLREAGLAVVEKAGWALKAEQDFRGKVPLTAQQLVDPTRLIELAGSLLASTVKIDDIVFRTFLHMGGGKARLPHRDLLPTATGYVSANPQVSHAEMAECLERIRQLTAALILAVGKVDQQVGARHEQMFSPGAILAAVQAQKGGFMVGQDAKCWQKYCELFQGYSLAQELRDTIVSLVIAALPRGKR